MLSKFHFSTLPTVSVVLLDLLLPKVHGFEVLKKLKSNPKTVQIPVVILSNLGDKKDINQGMQLGASDYLIKANFTPDEIIEKVEAIIGKGGGVSASIKPETTVEFEK